MIEATEVLLSLDPPYRSEWTLHGLIRNICLRPIAFANPLSSLVSGQTADLRSLFGGTTPLPILNLGRVRDKKPVPKWLGNPQYIG